MDNRSSRSAAVSKPPRIEAWIVKHDDGTWSQHFAEPGTNGISPGIRVWSLEQPIDLEIEDWDVDAGARRPLPDRQLWRINQEHLCEHGHRSIEYAHLRKELEARMILAGVAIVGAVSKEAAALNIPVADLAQTIVDKADVLIDRELERIVARRGVADPAANG